MEIAAPAEETGWKLPQPVGDRLKFDLPFNFRSRGRVAILSFFYRYLLDHGEGSAGRFFTGPPKVSVNPDPDGGPSTAGIPAIASTIWLKPFDFGVSQEMTITLPKDPESGLYSAYIELRRVSGTRESWLRLNNGFISLVRRHFLHWRAVTREEREEMYVEAEGLLRIHAGLTTDLTDKEISRTLAP
jgi:hypothetical protein